jgi:hypothetical protein
MLSRRIFGLLFGTLCMGGMRAQVIEFEANGYKYHTLTKNGLTIMFAPLPTHVREYSIIQVAVSNGSKYSYIVRPEDFVFTGESGTPIPAAPARQVVSEMISKARRGDVVRLVTAYESGIYGNTQYKSTNGYEQRRQSALAEVSSTKLKAAAAASAIAFVQTKLGPGESTDGALFYATAGKPLGAGRLQVRAAGSVFDFPVLP